MTMGDKISQAAQKAKGKIKEVTGKAPDDKSMGAEEKADQVPADVKQAADKVGGAVKDATDE